jgi:KipI family sensor histidine kinase inhibitor
VARSRPIRLVDFGDSALAIACKRPQSWALAARLRRRLPGLEETVVGADTLVVRFEPTRIPRELLVATIEDLAEALNGAPDHAELVALDWPGAQTSAGPLSELVVEVVYDGEDLAQVAASSGLAVEEVIRAHSAATYRVAHFGFLPGFAYLEGLDPRLKMPRLAKPRPRVPAGSVAIAGLQTCIYPTSCPGGWRLLGRTEMVLFDASKSPPSPLRLGMRVRFQPRSS